MPEPGWLARRPRCSAGRPTYASPYILEHLVPGQLEGEVEEYVQVAGRPDGTVDAVWNTVRDGVPVVVQATSSDGGASFSTPTPVSLAPLRRRSTFSFTAGATAS